MSYSLEFSVCKVIQAAVCPKQKSCHVGTWNILEHMKTLHSLIITQFQHRSPVDRFIDCITTDNNDFHRVCRLRRTGQGEGDRN